MAEVQVAPVKISKKKSKRRAADVPETAMVPEAPPAVVAADDSAPKKRKKVKASAPEAEKPAKKARVPKAEVQAAKTEAQTTSNTSTASDDTTVGEEVAPADPLAITNFELNPATRSRLLEKGIKALFPIQAQTLDHCIKGFDMVGRARTGCGKTLAFVLPIVERLAARTHTGPRYSRKPSVIVLTPTRELAKQVHADFDFIGKGSNLATLAVYGGAEFRPQETALRRGVDIVVGTPGRVKDHMERGNLDLSEISFRVLDECDEMLNMGFVEDVEKILSGGASDQVQTMLFSATLPSWVKSITARFLNKSHKTVDLVGTEKLKASTSVKHMYLPCHWTQRAEVVASLVGCYGALGSTIVFAETKRTADELATALGESHGARPLHGDIPQNQRESTLAGFRSKKFRVLVATDVAARGLDIKEVELVVMTDPPKDPETYIHRSGRTGRAGSSGTCVVLVDKKKEGLIPLIERKAGLKMQRIGTPQPSDLARVAAERASEALQEVPAQDLALFLPAADSLLAGMEPRRALAAALVRLVGHSATQARSLLTAHEGFTSLLFTATAPILRPGFIFATLKQQGIPEDTVEQAKRMSLTADNHSAIFDVPSDCVETFTSAFPEGGPASLAVAHELPALKDQKPPAPYVDDRRGYGSSSRGSHRGGSRGGGSFRGGGRAGGGRGGFGSSRGGRFSGPRSGRS